MPDATSPTGRQTSSARPDQPVFVLCTARSGSTLLRRVLDAHPEVACPSELNLVGAFEAIQFAASNAFASDQKRATLEADRLCKEIAARTVGAYAAETGKRVWCEKSLPSVDAVEMLLRIFPGARFICLYRECADTLASLIEACPYGYGAYGVEPYIRSAPHNFVAALATYWADKVDLIRRFEDQHPESCHRLRYEDLVCNPTETCARMFGFLSVAWRLEFASSKHVFSSPFLTGAGDHKTRYTTAFNIESVGRGWTIPVGLIPEAVHTRIDEMNTNLGYPPLDADVRAYRVRALPKAAAAMNGANDDAAAMVELFGSRLPARLRRNGNGGRKSPTGTVKIVLADQPHERPWIIDFDSGELRRGEEPTTCTALTDTATLLGIANGSCNPAVALRHATLKVVSDEVSDDELFAHLDALVDVVRGSVAQTERPRDDHFIGKGEGTYGLDQRHVRA